MDAVRLFSKRVLKYYKNKILYNVVSVFFPYINKGSTKCGNKNVAFPSALHDPSSTDCKQSNSMKTRALLNLDKKYHKLFFRTKHLPNKGLIENRCNAFEAVPERRAIHK